MSAGQTHGPSRGSASSRLAQLLHALPPAGRPAALHEVVSFRPSATLKSSLAVGELRAAFADFWEERSGEPIPVAALRALLAPPVPIATVMEFTKLSVVRGVAEIEAAFLGLVRHFEQRLAEIDQQPHSISGRTARRASDAGQPRFTGGDAVDDLVRLIEQGRKFSTLYADPPWPYRNTSSRAAAVNHYPTISVADICAEPVQQLVTDNAHLHLWTTNSFLREAFDVIESWGFRYKSCFVWVKPQIGLGNYWRVSHEYLLLGVRGRLRFLSRQQRSWRQLPRSIHSRKPDVVRALIETVSPGPYLELYGRERFLTSSWTVYGNQVEQKWF